MHNPSICIPVVHTPHTNTARTHAHAHVATLIDTRTLTQEKSHKEREGEGERERAREEIKHTHTPHGNPRSMTTFLALGRLCKFFRFGAYRYRNFSEDGEFGRSG